MVIGWLVNWLLSLVLRLLDALGLVKESPRREAGDRKKNAKSWLLPVDQLTSQPVNQSTN